MLHNRQFILTQKKIDLFPDWETQQMANGYTIYYHPHLPVYLNRNNTVAIIGDAWQVDPIRNSPEEIIEGWDDSVSLETIYAEENTWCGRFLIVTKDFVLSDATGNLGCFYTGEYISSSFALLSQQIDKKPNTPPSIACPEEANYMPGRLTICNKIRRLLPSQKLEYTIGEASPRPLIFTAAVEPKTNILDEFELLFFNGIEAMYMHYKGYNIWLPISGGKDSRVCLAAFEKLGKAYSIYVFQNSEAKYAGCYQDLGVSKLLSRTIHKKLTTVYGDSKHLDREKADEFEKHTAGLTMMSARWQYPCDTMTPVASSGNKVLQVRNNIWELVCDDYNHNNVMNTPEKILEKWHGRDKLFEQSIEDWLQWIENDKTNKSISLGDRAYWDLRLGCWLADGMQGFDVFDNIETINILNCRKYISLLMALDVKTKGTREFEVELANKWCPAFANVPYEEDYYDFTLFAQKWRGKIKRKIEKLVKKL